MPLEILGPLVLIGILSIAVLLHMTGQSAIRLLSNETDANGQWLRQYPEITASEITLSTDKRAALVKTKHGLGIVWSIGADTTARLLPYPLEVIDTHNGIQLKLHDFSAPALNVNLSNPSDREAWFSALDHTVKAAT